MNFSPKNLLPKLKGSNRLETLENLSILLIIIGSAIFSLGIGLSAASAKGAPVIIAMFGILIAFLSTGFLIFTWLSKENMLPTIVFGSFILSFSIFTIITGAIDAIMIIGTIVSTVVVSGILIGIYFLITKRYPW